MSRLPCTCAPGLRQCAACRAYERAPHGERAPAAAPATPPLAYVAQTLCDLQGQLTEVEQVLAQCRDALRTVKDSYRHLAHIVLLLQRPDPPTALGVPTLSSRTYKPDSLQCGIARVLLAAGSPLHWRAITAALQSASPDAAPVNGHSVRTRLSQYPQFQSLGDGRWRLVLTREGAA